MISQQYCKSKKKKKKKIKSGKKLLVEIQQIKDEYLLKANLNEHGDNTIYWKKFDLFSNLAQYVNEIHQYFDSETMWECDKCYPLAKQSLKQISDLKKLNEQESELDKKELIDQQETEEKKQQQLQKNLAEEGQLALEVANLDHHGIQNFWPNLSCLINMSQYIKKGSYYVHYYYYSTMKECRKCYKIAQKIVEKYQSLPISCQQIEQNYLDVANLYHRDIKDFWKSFEELIIYEQNIQLGSQIEIKNPKSHFYLDNGQIWECEVCFNIVQDAIIQLINTLLRSILILICC
eukprot:TRINITY_DN4988_c0_g1_i1.p1 TRINITY_DN4988_c0_g1~~TRINITY_DN4988_c0_g1_i1.p1  ORF type:complete len:291 (-),score=45.60 TRINITY_DN4988_c0_g1_i1:329-1201(-)